MHLSIYLDAPRRVREARARGSEETRVDVDEQHRVRVAHHLTPKGSEVKRSQKTQVSSHLQSSQQRLECNISASAVHTWRCCEPCAMASAREGDEARLGE